MRAPLVRRGAKSVTPDRTYIVARQRARSSGVSPAAPDDEELVVKELGAQELRRKELEKEWENRHYFRL